MAESLIFEFISFTGLVATLLLFLVLTVGVAKQKHRILSSLKFQMSLIVGVWLLSELPEVLFSIYSPVGGYYLPSEAAELSYETIHFTSMTIFAVFMTWRALRFLR